MDPIIETRALTHTYVDGQNEEMIALDGISLSIMPGEFVAIIGTNGSGKSTLARHFNALLTPTKGTCLVGGLDTSVEENLWQVRQTVGMVFQNPDNQIVAAVVEEDVAFGLENIGVPGPEIRPRVKRLLLMWACFLTLSTHRIACRADKSSASRLPALSLLNPNALSLTSQQPCSIRKDARILSIRYFILIRTKALPLSILRTRWKKPFWRTASLP